MAEFDLSLKRFVNRSALIRANHQRRDQQFQLFDRLYYKQHWMQSPTDESDYQVVMPIHTLVVNTAHAILTGFPPNVRVYPNNPSSERDLERADDVELWHLGVDHMNELEHDQDVKAQAVFNQCLYGVGCIREVYDFPKSWLRSDYEEFSYDVETYPIVQQALTPKQVYWELGNPPRGQFRTVFYEMLMTVHDIEVTYGIDLHPRLDEKGLVLDKDWMEMRPVLDWWEWIGGAIWHCVFTTVRDRHDPEPYGQWLKPPTEMPEYFILPYHIFPFYQTSALDSDRWGLSILYPLTDIPHHMEILASRQMRAMEMYADPAILALRGPQGGDDPIPIDKSPGSIIDLRTGDDVRYLQWQGSPPDMRYLWERFDQIVQELAFSQTLLSQGNSADASGFRTALERETSLLKITKGMQNYERALSRLYAARAYSMSKLSSDRRIPARGVNPDDERYSVSLTGERIGAYRDIVVEIKPQFPGDKQREINTANQAVASRFWSLDEAMEYIQVRNKRKMRESILRDQVEFHPQTIAALSAELVQKRQQQVADEQSLTAQLEGGVPSAPGLPPGPQPSAPGLPGLPSAPGQPAGASPASPQSAGLDNRLAAYAQPGGTPVTPASLTEQLGTVPPPSRRRRSA